MKRLLLICIVSLMSLFGFANDTYFFMTGGNLVPAEEKDTLTEMRSMPYMAINSNLKNWKNILLKLVNIGILLNKVNPDFSEDELTEIEKAF